MVEFFDSKVEKSILANILSDSTLLEQVLEVLSSDDFYVENHRLLYDIISKFYSKYYKLLSRDILVKWLDRHKPEYKLNILTLFTELQATGNDGYTKYHIIELQSLTTKRKLYSIFVEIKEGLKEDIDPEKLYTNLTREILTKNSLNAVDNTSVFDKIDDRIKEYLDKKEHPEKYAGISYGIKELDEVTGGMFKQQLYMIMGRTSAGKSRALFNFACNVAKTGKKVMFCTIEMDARMIQHMWESREAHLPLTKIMRATLTEEEEQQYINFLNDQKNSKHPFYIVDIPQGCTTGIIESEIVIFEKIHGQYPDIVIVDYANLIQPVSKYKDRPEKYDHVFRELHEIARAYNLVCYTAAQQNRESLKATKIGTEHVSFSDAASHHCDSIFHIFADDVDEVNGDVQIEVIKGRYHAKGAIRLAWNRETNRICSWDDSVKLPGSKDVNKSQDGTGQSNQSSMLNEETEY